MTRPTDEELRAFADVLVAAGREVPTEYVHGVLCMRRDVSEAIVELHLAIPTLLDELAQLRSELSVEKEKLEQWVFMAHDAELDLLRTKKELAKAREVLLEVEWNYVHEDTWQQCPCCYRNKPGQGTRFEGHLPHCTLSAALKGET